TPAGLSLNATTGQINPATSTANTYEIIYTTPAGMGCPPVSDTVVIVINEPPSAEISYVGSPWCENDTARTPILNGTTGGTYYRSPAGLTINSVTGVITPSSSSAGTYTVIYITPASGSCPADTSPPVPIAITTPPAPILAYPDDSWCVFDNPVNPQPLTGSGSILGGTYTAVPVGLAINASTGQITPAASDTGTYTVIY